MLESEEWSQAIRTSFPPCINWFLALGVVTNPWTDSIFTEDFLRQGQEPAISVQVVEHPAFDDMTWSSSIVGSCLHEDEPSC